MLLHNDTTITKKALIIADTQRLSSMRKYHYRGKTLADSRIRAVSQTKNTIFPYTLMHIYIDLYNGFVVVSIFLDFKKAFYCVDHEILLTKLSRYGITWVAWNRFRSHSDDRKQCVSLNGHNTQFCSIESGVTAFVSDIHQWFP